MSDVSDNTYFGTRLRHIRLDKDIFVALSQDHQVIIPILGRLSPSPDNPTL